MGKWKHILLFLFFTASLCGQTIIMNEVSNGANGNKEYVEFVVVDTSVVYDCNNTVPPCIDLRGWIFDDNSGYHGSSGIASGCMRFSNNAIWSCVPVGTIILIYNGSDRNNSIPPDDLSMSDGNCRIIAPDNNTALFDKNSTTPGASACSYPASGWSAGGNWNNTLLANAGDCARIVNLAGCEVFSLCWGTDNQNNLIYFSGSGSTKNWYFNSGDPYQQSNWSSGTAPANETPGAANNAANLAFINQFNNGCTSITPLNASITSNNAGCTCTGSASINASGSIGPYTYLWSNGATGSSVSGLCSGTYTVTVTSAIHCSETLTVVIASSGNAITDAGTPQTLNCNNTSVVLNGSCSLPGATFSWAGPGIISGASSAAATVNQPGTYTLTAGSGACANTATVSVSQDIASPAISIANPSDLTCTTTSVVLQASSASVVSFQWTGGPASASYQVTAPGTYTVQATNNLNGCSASATILVNQNTNMPTAAIAPHQHLNCSITSVTLTGTSNISNPQFQWINGPSTTTYEVNTAGTYTLEVTDPANGCSNSNTTTVNNTSVLPDVTIGQPALITCAVQQVTLNGSSSVPGAVYQWNSGPQTMAYAVAAAGTYSLTVTNPATSCSATATITVSANTLTPDVTILQPQPLNCNNSSVQVTAISSVSNATFSWNDGATGATISATTAGTYTVTVTNPSNACTSSSSITVSEDHAAPDISISTPAVITCSHPQTSITATSSVTNVSWLWNTGNSTSSLSTSAPGTYTLTATDMQNGCSATMTVQVNQSTNYPDAGFTSAGTQGCAPLCISLTPALSANAGWNYSWTFSNGEHSTGYNAGNCFTVPGTYNATLSVTNEEGCTSSVTVNDIATVFPVPHAAFTYNPANPTTYDPLVSFTDQSSGAISWLWAFDSTHNSTDQHPAWTYEAEGLYPVTLLVENVYGCADSITQSILVEGEFAVYVPNSFTPNTDVFNPTWRPVGVGVDESNYEMSIYDRWGMKIFSTTDWENGAWDGTFGGKPAPVDSYIYKIKVGPKSKTTNESIRYLSGHLNLIR